MNKLIKQLAEQAGFALPEYWGKEDRDSLEKFAKLIVEECIKAVDLDGSNYDDKHDSPVELQAQQDARKMIKEYFDFNGQNNSL